MDEPYLLAIVTHHLIKLLLIKDVIVNKFINWSLGKQNKVQSNKMIWRIPPIIPASHSPHTYYCIAVKLLTGLSSSVLANGSIDALHFITKNIKYVSIHDPIRSCLIRYYSRSKKIIHNDDKERGWLYPIALFISFWINKFPIRHEKVNFTSNFFEVVWWFYFCCNYRIFGLRTQIKIFSIPFTTITPQQQSRELDSLKINISSCRGVFSISEAAILLILHYESNGIFNFLWEGVLYDNSLMNF